MVVAGLIFLVTTGYGQSLGDVARQQRQKQQSKDNQGAHKVITNEDIPEHPESASASSSENAGENSSHEASPPASSAGAEKTGEQWKSEIQAQKDAVASLQSQIDQLNSSIHFVEANRYRNGVQWNERQVKKQDEVQRMQTQLEEQKKKLEDMQESARRQGFGNAVYDP